MAQDKDRERTRYKGCYGEVVGAPVIDLTGVRIMGKPDYKDPAKKPRAERNQLYDLPPLRA